MSSENNSDGLLPLLLLFVGGIGVIVWQVYEYLRFGIWNPVSVITVLEWMRIQWAYTPDDWNGLHELLKILPLSIAMIFPTLVVIWVNN